MIFIGMTWRIRGALWSTGILTSRLMSYLHRMAFPTGIYYDGFEGCWVEDKGVAA